MIHPAEAADTRFGASHLNLAYEVTVATYGGTVRSTVNEM
jgi:hypothetical protein